MKVNLDGQTALVTGASRGIGHAIALALADNGATVVGTATSGTGAEAVHAALAARGGRGEVLDVGDPASVDALAARLGADGLMPGILVNNAGITRDGLLARMSGDDWDDVINVNLSSLYRLCKACARAMMKARGGRVINVSSVVGALGNAGQVGYAAAKAGQIGFTRALARELAARNITVNAVAPGFIDTDMTRDLDAAHREGLLGQIPLGRLGDTSEVASAVCFLASPEAAYITGQTIHVNGGMYMG